MPHRRSGLRKKIRVAFLLQIAAIGFAAVLGVYGASVVLKDVLVHRALQDEATYFRLRLQADPSTPLPDTASLGSYRVRSADEAARLPAPLRDLAPGFHELSPEEGGALVLVDGTPDDRLMLLFRQQEVDRLAFWFGVVPLAIVLLVAYVIAWSTYRASRRAVSPVIWLAGQVQQWDPKEPGHRALHPDYLPGDVDGEALVLASSLHDYGTRIDAFVDRERNFTRDASHELRTPLAVIRVAGDMMAADDGLSPMSRRALKRIQGAGRDMEALIEAFLILAREDDTGLPNDDFAVGDVVADEAEKARVMLGAKPVDVVVDMRDDFHLQAPARVLGVLLGNLLRNASHYTDEGRITVTVERGRIDVIDTGIGMSAEALSHAFEPHYRGGGRVPEGQGLGLSIVRRLARRYGWDVRLDSVAGQGTTATVTFPAPAAG